MGQYYWQEGTRLNIGGVKVRILDKGGDNVNQKEFDDKTIKEQYNNKYSAKYIWQRTYQRRWVLYLLYK